VTDAGWLPHVRGDLAHVDALYRTTPPWDIGRPQPAFVALADAGRLRGRVLSDEDRARYPE
jgi:hypothetical protein